MLQFIKIWLWRIKRKLPQNQVDADYMEMAKKLKKLEIQVEKNAEQIELAKASFLKNIYHEIRTPLNAIMGFTNLIANDKKISPEEKEEFISLMNKSSQDFLRIMDDIIQASLLEAGVVNIKKEVCQLATFIDEIHTYFNIRKHILEKKSIVFLRNIPEKYIDLHILCDKQKINQILYHLLENAFKFTEKGTIEFGFHVKNQLIEFYVKDSGIGKLTGKEDFIFGSFTKIDNTDSSKNGLGLGLSICKNLVRLMNGKIWCQSKPGKGSSFFFTIPFQPVEHEQSVPAQKTSLIEKTLKGHNSLVV